MEFFQVIEEFFKLLWVQVALLIIFATVHGYVGAWLAVRMLFSPRNPVKLFGLTVFPQGMIPRHRGRLAEAIGKAVGEELVSQETIVEELFGKEFLRKKIQNVVDSYTEELISQDYPSLIEALPLNIREPILDAISSLQLKISTYIESVLKSEETARSIHGFVGRRVDEVLSRRISETVDEETFNKILSFLEKRIRTIIKEPTFEQKIKDFISRRVDDLANTKTPLGEMFTADAVALLKEKASGQIEPIIHQLAEIATAERTRNQIGALIKSEVHGYYEQLPFFKKMFVSRENLLGEVDDLVNESLPKRVEDMLRGEFFAEEAQNFLDRTIDNALERPLPEVIGNIAPEQLERLKSQISKSIVSLLQGEEMMISVSAYLTDTLQKLRPHSLGAILQTAHPEAEDKLKNMLSRTLMNVLNREETVKIINKVLSVQIERLLAAPIGKLSGHISEEKVRQAGKSLTETIISAAKEKLPEAIREFDIGSVVRDKINKYPVEKLESLVLSIAKEHLRTIELFGALFGLIIGIVQALLSYWAFAK
ncbi:MAG: DUF445 family protein [Acidobacteria bacterium]|jgi:uncharacterized membrane protein YheB (UPF0754 family)|nr:DUF445 family protein [Acidobacteriota bacterium]